MNKTYTHNDWLRESDIPEVMFILKNYKMIYHARKLQCLKCETVGFYGTFSSANDPEYRMCKFCGLWQKVDGEEKRCNMFYCSDCKEARKFPEPICEILKYDWNLGGKEHKHSLCGETMTQIVDWPPENQKHPFHLLKNEGQLIEVIRIPPLGKKP